MLFYISKVLFVYQQVIIVQKYESKSWILHFLKKLYWATLNFPPTASGQPWLSFRVLEVLMYNKIIDNLHVRLIFDLGKKSKFP
jgi:hypothetical protein